MVKSSVVDMSRAIKLQYIHVITAPTGIIQGFMNGVFRGIRIRWIQLS